MTDRFGAQRRAADDVLLGEVARALGISRTTAWVRCRCGEIPAEWRGGRYIVKRRVLKRLLAAQLAGSQPQCEPPAAIPA